MALPAQAGTHRRRRRAVRRRNASTRSSTPKLAGCTARTTAARLDACERRHAHLEPRLVLRRRHRRAAERRRRLFLQREPLPLGRRRASLSRPSRARRAATTTTRCGSIRRPRSAASSASTRARSSRSTAARTWSSWYNQPTGQFYHVITDNRFPYWVYGAQQDSGAAGMPSRTNTLRRHHADEFREVTAGGESDNIAPDPSDPDIIYGGRVDRLDLRTGQTRSIDPTLASPGSDAAHVDASARLLPSRSAASSTSPISRSSAPTTAASIGRSSAPTSRAKTPARRRISIPSTAALRHAAGTRRGVSTRSLPSRLADHDLWVGTDDGLIWRTRDEGAHWTNVTPAALTAWSKVGIIDASHFDAETAYAAVDRHRLDDFQPYIYRTHDGGKSWTLVANGIPDGSSSTPCAKIRCARGCSTPAPRTRHLRLLRRRRPLAAAAAEPPRHARCGIIDVHGDDLVIATHGRAFWILDDVTPLRQLDDIGSDPSTSTLRTRDDHSRTAGRLHRHADAEGRAARAEPSRRRLHRLRRPRRQPLGRTRDNGCEGRDGAQVFECGRPAGAELGTSPHSARMVCGSGRPLERGRHASFRLASSVCGRRRRAVRRRCVGAARELYGCRDNRRESADGSARRLAGSAARDSAIRVRRTVRARS